MIEVSTLLKFFEELANVELVEIPPEIPFWRTKSLISGCIKVLDTPHVTSHCVRQHESNMAAETSLRDTFEQGFILHSQLEDDDEPSSSEIFQVIFI